MKLLVTAGQIQTFILGSGQLREMVGASHLVRHLVARPAELHTTGDAPADTKPTEGESTITDQTAESDDGARTCPTSLVSVLLEELDLNPADAIKTSAAGSAVIDFENKKNEQQTFALVLPFLCSRYSPGLRVSIRRFNEGEDPAPKRESVRGTADENLPDAVTAELPETPPLALQNPRSGLPAVLHRDGKTGGRLDARAVRCRAAYEIYSASERHEWVKEGDGAALASDTTQPPNQPQFTDDLEKLLPPGRQDSYLALVHADGNELGKMFASIVQEKDLGLFDQVSATVAEITKTAAREAFAVVTKDFPGASFPVRPLILAGDDLTVIVRADLAFDFTERYLAEFEERSKDRMSVLMKGGESKHSQRLWSRLTACAGIAFFHSHFPVLAAYTLAEELCSSAKRQAAARAKSSSEDSSNGGPSTPSAFNFHRLTDSFSESLELIAARHTACGINLNFGPYGVADDGSGLPRWQQLRDLAAALQQLSRGSLRTLLTTLYHSKTQVVSDYRRLITVAKSRERTKDYAERVECLLAELTGGAESGQRLWTEEDKRCPLLHAHWVATMSEQKERLDV